MKTTPEQLQKIRDLLNKADQPPWSLDAKYDPPYDDLQEVLVAPNTSLITGDYNLQSINDKNSKLIVEVVNRIPGILDDLADLQRRVDAYTAMAPSLSMGKRMHHMFMALKEENKRLKEELAELKK